MHGNENLIELENSQGSKNNIPPNSNILPTSMRLLQPLWHLGCQFNCCMNLNVNDNRPTPDSLQSLRDSHLNNISTPTQTDINKNMAANSDTENGHTPNHTRVPRNNINFNMNFNQAIINEYISYCHMYTSPTNPRINPGILTALRFSLPNVRVSPHFHDADMLAFVELLLQHCNTHLKFIKRLDFSFSSKYKTKNPTAGIGINQRGFTSHAAYALAKVLQISQNIQEVYVQRNKLGHYGATSIFMACGQNPTIRVLSLRRCKIGERGAAAFIKYCLHSDTCGLRDVDLSANRIGFIGCKLIENALLNDQDNYHTTASASASASPIEVDLEANLILQEVMNSITHGLGILICIIGTYILMVRVQYKSYTHIVSCAVYSASLLVLYTSSTLYHSFFTLLATRYIFEIFDHCAIYILIAGSYTPFLSIPLHHKTMWSVYLLAFIWICCIMGICVEAFFSKWKYKSYFSLSMYLAMGWCCVVCIPDMVEILPQGAINYIIMGGVAYTTGVPFFVRNNNLDHSIWHCFVLAGSIFHWFSVYFYMVPMSITIHNHTTIENENGNYMDTDNAMNQISNTLEL